MSGEVDKTQDEYKQRSIASRLKFHIGYLTKDIADCLHRATSSYRMLATSRLCHGDAWARDVVKVLIRLHGSDLSPGDWAMRLLSRTCKIEG